MMERLGMEGEVQVYIYCSKRIRSQDMFAERLGGRTAHCFNGGKESMVKAIAGVGIDVCGLG